MNLPFDQISIIAWLFALARALLYSLIVTGGSFRAATAITPWSKMDADQKFSLKVAMFIVQAGVMLQFLDSTIQKFSTQ